MSDTPMSIPFGRPHFGDEEIAAVTAVLRSGWVGMGPETLAFEQDLAQWLGCPHVVTVSSCTGALFLSLLVHGIGPGDEVICPALTWCSSANAALYLGAKVVFCDVDPDTLSLTPELVAAQVTERTKAVVAVHYGGLAIDVEALRRVLPARIAIVEDAAHALGARFADGRRVGGSGNLTCFSFYANKNLSTGEGGAIALSDPELAARLGALRQHGLGSDAWSRYSRPSNGTPKIELDTLGYKLNYTDLQACLGRVQLRRQDAFCAHRRAIADYYLGRLAEIPGARVQTGLTLPEHALHLFALRLPVERLNRGRDQILQAARARGIGISLHYPPLHAMPLYQSDQSLPVTERLGRELITMPIGAAMTLDDAARCWDVLIEETR